MGDGGAGRLRAWSGDAKFGRAFGAAQFRPPYSTARHRRKTRDATGASPRAPTLSHPYPVAPRWATSRLRHFEQPALVGHFATFQEHKTRQRLICSCSSADRTMLAHHLSRSRRLSIHGAIIGSLVQMEPVRDAPTTAAMRVPSHPDRSSPYHCATGVGSADVDACLAGSGTR